ncbi:uncharacterized protein LOC135203880 [Macrobrachium nipponense]|uniref:uncharacterized protein LOC135203880 n=1 Tax=Macrobrachium nipponense TaxID=159736 RepID=UPI0030C82CD2
MRNYGSMLGNRSTAILSCLLVTSSVTFLYNATILKYAMVQLAQTSRKEDGNYTRKCQIPSLEHRFQFYSFLNIRDYLCQNLKWLGEGDGQKAVCMDANFKISPGDCHVLSFGINNEWSFDDEFARRGCKVYSFDPTMDAEDHQRSPNVQFFKLGISNIQGTRKVGMGSDFRYCKVDRYENILARLNLTDTTISYLKLDIELSELEFFQDIFRNSPHLLNNVQQIGVELHHGHMGEGVENPAAERDPMSPVSTFQHFWQYFHELKCHGFKLIHSHPNFIWTEAVWGRIGPPDRRIDTV